MWDNELWLELFLEPTCTAKYFHSSTEYDILIPVHRTRGPNVNSIFIQVKACGHENKVGYSDI